MVTRKPETYVAPQVHMHAANCVSIVLLLRLDSLGKGRGLGRKRKWELVGSFDVRASGNRCGTVEGGSVCAMRGRRRERWRN